VFRELLTRRVVTHKTVEQICWSKSTGAALVRWRTGVFSIALSPTENLVRVHVVLAAERLIKTAWARARVPVIAQALNERGVLSGEDICAASRRRSGSCSGCQQSKVARETLVVTSVSPWGGGEVCSTAEAG
jgi:hypothetical protein